MSYEIISNGILTAPVNRHSTSASRTCAVRACGRGSTRPRRATPTGRRECLHPRLTITVQKSRNLTESGQVSTASGITVNILFVRRPTKVCIQTKTCTGVHTL